MKKDKILILFLFVFLIGIISFGPFIGVSIYSKIYGEKQLLNKAISLTSNERDFERILHKMSDWVNENMNYDTSISYHYPCFPFVMWRKTRPSPEWVMTVKRGGCEEHATLFAGLVRSIGIESRVVYNKGEDHTWTELLINGLWIHFDPMLNPEYRLNDPGFYERSRSEGGWGKQLSCVFYFDSEGTPQEVTSRYTETGRLNILVEKNGLAVKDARVIIKSHFLMDNYDNYGKPWLSFEKKTNSSGQCEFNLGSNKYTVIVKKGIVFGLKDDTVVSVLENQNISLKMSISKNVFLLSKDQLSLLFIILIIFLLFVKFKKTK